MKSFKQSSKSSTIKFHGFLLLLFVGYCAFSSEIALSIPEFFALGYGSCSSCHVSPSGGGVLSEYGKSVSDETATWSYEGQGRTDYGLFERLPAAWQDPILLGGDVRYLSTKSEQFEGHFWMQADAEAAVRVTDELTFVGSAGLYGRDRTREYRRHYVLLTLGDNFKARAGRFMPAYGIAWPDHTIATRRVLGFDQAQENYAAEASYLGEYGEVFLTGVVGQKLDLEGSRQQGFETAGQEKATLVRASWFTSERSQLGASYKFGRRGEDINRQWGIFGQLAVWKAHLMADMSRLVQSGTYQQNTYSYSKLGIEAVKGLHTFYAHSWVSDHSENRFGMEWHIVPHLEFATVWGSQYFNFIGHYHF